MTYPRSNVVFMLPNGYKRSKILTEEIFACYLRSRPTACRLDSERGKSKTESSHPARPAAPVRTKFFRSNLPDLWQGDRKH